MKSYSRAAWLALSVGVVVGGMAVATEIQVSEDVSADKSLPSIAARGNDVVVVWQSEGQDGDQAGVFGRRLSASGELLGDEFAVNSHTTGEQRWPDVTVRSDGGFVVVWDGAGPGDGSGVFARRFDDDGSALGADFIVNTTTAGWQADARVSSDGSNNFVVSWSDSYGGYEYPRARLFDANGDPVGDEIPVDDSVFFSATTDVAMASSGEFVVAWQQDDVYDTWNVGKRFNSDGSPASGVFLIDATPDWRYGGFRPRASMWDDGGFVVSWSWEYYTGRARVFDPVGTGGCEIPVDSEEIARGPVVTWLDSGDFAALWRRVGSTDLWSNRFADDCTALGDTTYVGETNTGSSYSWFNTIESSQFGEVVAYVRDQSVYVWLPFEDHLRDGVPADGTLTDPRALYRLDVPDCADTVEATLRNLSDDLDLALRSTHPPSSTEADCRSTNSGTTDESCSVASPGAGTWWLSVDPATGAGPSVDYNAAVTFHGCEGEDWVSHWPGDGSALDVVGTNHGTPEGGLGYATGMFGQGFYFDGINDALRVPHDSTLDVGSGDFSVALWLRTADADGRQVLLDNRSAGPTAGFEVFIEDGYPGVELADGEELETFAGTLYVADDRLHHLALTVDRETPKGGLLLVDGREALSFDPTNVRGDLVSTQDLMIGRESDAVGGGGWFSGIVDEIQLHGRSLAQREAVDGLGALTSWWPADLTPYDRGGLNHGTPEGGLGYGQGRYGPGFDLDGFDDAVRVPHDASLDLGTGDFTVAYWVRTTQDSGRGVVFDKRVNPPTGVQVYLLDGAPGIQLADGSATGYTSSSFITDGLLHFVVITVDRDQSGGGTIYVDGQPVEVFDPTGHQGSLSVTEDLMIGRRTDATGGDKFFDGIIDELMLFDRVLNPTELDWLYQSEGLIFLDGFESGDTSSWSVTAD